MEYIEPKKGDIVICIDDDSQNEDFGMSGLVFEGTKGLKVGREYEVRDIDLRHVPTNEKGTWTKEEYLDVRWYWTLAFIQGVGSDNFHKEMFLGHFKRKQ